jgi:hypothetical protein
MDNQPPVSPSNPADNDGGGLSSPNTQLHNTQPNLSQQPVIQPNFNTTPNSQPLPTPTSNSPGLIVLQWLTYAFWGWTVLGMSILTATVIFHFISGSTDWGFTPFGIAAVLVLLPLSVACDFFYSKHEPPKKTGVSSIVMVIHAVIFALFGVGSLIAAVFSVVSLFTSSSDTSGSQTALYSALIIFVLYLATLLRTLNPAKIPLIRRLYIIFMVISVGIIALLGLLGPVAHAHQTRNDTLIENNLNPVNDGVNNYAQTNKKLPSDLNNLNLSGDAQKLATNNSVEYLPNSKSPLTTNNSTYNYNTNDTNSSRATYYYQLCVTYKAVKKSSYSYGQNSDKDADGYATVLDVSSHPSGHTCYKLKTQGY